MTPTDRQSAEDISRLILALTECMTCLERGKAAPAATKSGLRRARWALEQAAKNPAIAEQAAREAEEPPLLVPATNRTCSEVSSVAAYSRRRAATRALAAAVEYAKPRSRA